MVSTSLFALKSNSLMLQQHACDPQIHSHIRKHFYAFALVEQRNGEKKKKAQKKNNTSNETTALTRPSPSINKTTLFNCSVVVMVMRFRFHTR